MRWTLVALMLAFLFSGWTVNAEEGGKAKSAKVEIKDLPAKVTDAAKAAVPDIVLTEARMRSKDGVDVYKLSGTVGEKTYELIIDADGKVIKSGEKGKEDGGKEGKGHKGGKEGGEKEKEAGGGEKESEGGEK